MTIAHGMTDAVTTCDCCGKSNLKATVIIELDSGEIVHYGRICASRNIGKTAKQITSEIQKFRKEAVENARNEYMRTDIYLKRETLLYQRNKLVSDEESRKNLTAQLLALTSVDNEMRASIAAKFNILAYEMNA